MSRDRESGERYVKELEVAYVKVNPQEAYAMLLEKIKDEIESVTKKLDEDKWWYSIKAATKRLQQFIDMLSEPYLKYLLGVVYPSMGADKVFADRMLQLCKLAENLIQEVEDKIEARLEEMLVMDRELSQHEKREIIEGVQKLLNTVILVQVAINEVANRFLTVMTMNTRPDTRPPLVNVLFGYDKL